MPNELDTLETNTPGSNEKQTNDLTVKPIEKAQSFVERTAGIIKNATIDIETAKNEYLKEKYGL